MAYSCCANGASSRRPLLAPAACRLPAAAARHRLCTTSQAGAACLQQHDSIPPLRLATPAGCSAPRLGCRKQNEDRYQLEVAEGAVDEGIPEIYAGAPLPPLVLGHSRTGVALVRAAQSLHGRSPRPCMCYAATGCHCMCWCNECLRRSSGSPSRLTPFRPAGLGHACTRAQCIHA